jgi:hypothetical protein
MIERTLKEFKKDDYSWSRIVLSITTDGDRGTVWFQDSLTVPKGSGIYYKHWNFGGPSRWWRRTPRSMTDALYAGAQYYDAAIERYERSIAQAEIAKETLDAAEEVIASL